MKAIKYDKDKLRYDLIPILAEKEMVKAMTVGAKKYGDDNYLQGKGLKWSRMYAAGLRHAKAFWQGKSIDETGIHTLGCAIAELMMLLESVLRKKGTDNRP